MHIPHGLMCCVCSHWKRLCSHLPFNNMHVIATDTPFKIVRCSDYSKLKPEEELI